MMRAYLLIAALASASALAGPILTSAPYPAGSAQPTSCAVDVDGRAFPCVLVPLIGGGGLVPTADLKGLAIPGTYQVVLTVSTMTGCTGGPAAWDCGGYGGSASTSPFTLTLRAGAAPSVPVVRLTP